MALRGEWEYLLGIDSTLQIGHLGVASRAQEDGLELVHAGIGEEQRRVIVRDDRRRGDWSGVSHCRKKNHGNIDMVLLLCHASIVGFSNTYRLASR